MGAPRFESHELGMSWLADEDEWMERASHAIVEEGRVWIIDPVDVEGLDERLAALGSPAGVIQLLDRHRRDCPSLAKRVGVTRFKLPFDGVPGSPFESRSIIDNRFWREVALWWPQRRALVVPEAVGTARYFRAGSEPIGIHPMLRLSPPREQLADLEPAHLLTGHGTGAHGPETAAALQDTLAASRRRTPRSLISVAPVVPKAIAARL